MKLFAALIAAVVGVSVPAAPAAAAPGLPDLITGPRTGDEIRVNSYNFDPTDPYTGARCDVEEGLISSPGVHRLLSFSVYVGNIGPADLRLGNPKANPNLFYFSPCHQHYHFDGFATYRLIDLNGAEVVAGRKIGFCLIDSYPPDNWDATDPHNQPRFTDCDRQGLSVGWFDRYGPTLHGQWIEIDGVPAGNYQVEVTVNPLCLIVEVTCGNNSFRFPVTIPPEPGTIP